MLDFDPNRAAPKPRDASTVIVLRENDSAGTLEVFCVKRHARSGFLGGAVVFPGGKVDVSDTLPGWEAMTTAPSPRSLAFESESANARALAVAACRELLEEATILPALPATLDAVDLRRSIDERTLYEALGERGLTLDIAKLLPFGRWVTPEAESRRFDARFYLLALPPGQEGDHDRHETTSSFWASPREILQRFFEGEIMLAPPTTRALELLTRAPGLEAAARIAEAQCLEPICPVFVTGESSPFLALPGDPAHPVRERRVDGATRFIMQDGKFISAPDR